MRELRRKLTAALFERQAGRTDLGQLRIDRRAVGVVRRHQLAKVDPSYFQVRVVANLRFPEISFLLTNLRGLIRRHADLIANRGIAQQAPQPEFASSHAVCAAKPTVFTAIATAPTAPIASRTSSMHSAVPQRIRGVRADPAGESPCASAGLQLSARARTASPIFECASTKCPPA